MSNQSLVVTGQNVLLPGSDQPQPATITVDIGTGKISDIQTVYTQQSPGGETTFIDAGDKFVLPGLVDAHVHLNEPGRTDWEGFWTGTRAAVAGGITTVVDMPLNSIPPTTTLQNLEIKRQSAQGQCWADVGFWGGVIPGNQADLKSLVAAGVKGFKCFLIESGVEEFPCVSEHDLHTHMQELQDQSTVLLFHAEMESDSSSVQSHEGRDPTEYQTFLFSRPQELEVNAISMITLLQEKYRSLRCHIVHLSASSALPVIRAARSRGLNLTVETCFHYLCLSADDIPNGRPEFKCCPPIRSESNRDALWEALIDGTIDCVVSDHSPCVSELKKFEEGDIMSAWGGINSLGFGLSLLWTESKKRGVSIGQIIRWTSEQTAKHAGLSSSKGHLSVGYDGDLIIWDPAAEFKVSKEQFHFKNKFSAYEGMLLNGVVQQTFLRGRVAYDRTQNGFGGLTPIGKLL
ncbi:allantoinase [Rhizopogon vinicolor AM-OR11-026]|uniref:allantoinase n=1 Tax=Rhizopogon vinicolor AM-OR11-026 TaxID=1314800 RepID=A0A1B7NCG4_9AGAM|nr:allantoinase [Rhizopogon vinicolor AM-OR11-026]